VLKESEIRVLQQKYRRGKTSAPRSNFRVFRNHKSPQGQSPQGDELVVLFRPVLSCAVPSIDCKATDPKASRSTIPLLLIALAFVLLLPCPALNASEKDAVQYGAGFIVNVPLPESEVARAVEEVAQNGIIRGTKEYNKDEYITGATVATSSRLFPAWTEGGKIFYKVRLHALDPRNFKNGGDVGTLAVRYIVMGQGDKNTVLRIEAVFVEEFRHTVHPSNGSVESSEYKDIHDHLEAIELMKQEAKEAEKDRQEKLDRKQRLAFSSSAPPTTLQPDTLQPGLLQPNASQPNTSQSNPSQSNPSQSNPSAGEHPAEASAPASTESLEQHVKDLRRQVERMVKSPGAPLKSAPFHTATTLQSLPTGTELLIVISTPYWYGVETHEGQHGWIPRDQLEQLP